jgi:hypothetical protein
MAYNYLDHKDWSDCNKCKNELSSKCNYCEHNVNIDNWEPKRKPRKKANGKVKK